MANNNTIFNYCNSGNPGFTIDRTTEYPNRNMTVRVRVNPTRVSEGLVDELHRNDMVCNPNKKKTIIVVTGFPPNMSRQRVLEIVHKYDKEAAILE